jgi:hypothetical protein
VARDRTACGVAVREFTVTWRLARAGASWQAVELRGAGGPQAVALC